MAKPGPKAQRIIDGITSKGVTAWEWALGADVNTDLLNAEAIDEAYEAVRAAIRDDIDEMAKREGQRGWAYSTLRGTVFPAIWTNLIATGVFLDFEKGVIGPANEKNLRTRLLREDQYARVRYNLWHEWNEKKREEDRDRKQDNQIVWNREVFDSMTDLAFDWMTQGEGDSRSVTHSCARKVLAISWFTGRRPYVESALHADFVLSDGPDWADDWVRVTGLGKKTKAVIRGEEPEQQIDIPLFGISAEEFLKGFRELREMEVDEPWYQPGIEKDYDKAKSGLLHYVNFEMDGAIADVFSPVTDAGYPLKLEPKSFRALWVSQGQHRQQNWCIGNGKRPANINGYAKRYIGHFGKKSMQDTAEYLRFTYLGDYPIPPLA